MYPWLNSIFSQLTQRALAGKLHHGLLLQGKPGLGKSYFARELGRFLLCKNPTQQACGQCQSCKLQQAGSHPDLHQIESEKQIGIDQIREATAKLVGKSQLSGAKVLIIHKADTMTEACANSLLKTLEEPTAQTHLLLTIDGTQAMLPTILSRCEKVLLPESNLPMTQNWLQEQGIEVQPDVLKVYSAVPLRLKQMAEDTEGLSYEAFLQTLTSLQQHNALDLATAWQHHCDEVLQWLQLWVRERDNHQFWSVYQSLIQARQAIQNPGVNKIMILCGLLNQIQHRLKQPD